MRVQLSGGIFPTGAAACLEDPDADIVLRRAHLSLEVCPRPGEARPFSAWRSSGSDGTTTVNSNGALELRTVSARDAALMGGPSPGTVSIPDAYAHPALVVRGQQAASCPRSFTMQVDGLFLENVDAFSDLVVCLPDRMRGDVVDVRLGLLGGVGSCGQANPQLAVVDAIEVVDDPTCTTETPPPSHWTGPNIVNEDDAGIFVAATSCANGFQPETFVQAPPAGTHAALRVRYAADTDVDVYLATLGVEFLPSTDGAIVEVERCIDARAAGQALPLRFSPRMRFSNTGAPGDECVTARARFESVEVVENESCPSLF